MEGFSVSMALLDAVPVIFFALTIITIGTAAQSPVVIIGGVLMVIGGLCKVLWKLLLGLDAGNYQILNKLFLPFMIIGFVLTVIGIVIAFYKKVFTFKGVAKKILSFPAVLFLSISVAAFIGMGVISRQQSTAEFNQDAGKNWIAEAVNSTAQISLFLSVISAKHKK